MMRNVLLFGLASTLVAWAGGEDPRRDPAGRPNILAQFTGTLDPETNQLSGDYVMDPEKVIVPGHPLIYRVETAN